MTEAQKWIKTLKSIKDDSKSNVIPEEPPAPKPDDEDDSHKKRLVEPVDIDKKKSGDKKEGAKETKQGCCIIL